MRTGPGDPLLGGTRFLLNILTAIAGLACIASLLAIPLTWIFRARIVVAGAVASTDLLVGGSVLMAGFAVITACAFLFLRQLIAIIDTVAHGSPFIRDNARRLRSMAWLVLVLEGITLLAAPLGAWIESVYPQAHFEIRFDFGGLITALLLFILARVFETGARLAEDVEGTV